MGKGNNRHPAPDAGPHLRSHFCSNQAELLYVEQMVPSEGARVSIYWSACNFFFGKRGGYAGIQHQDNVMIDNVPFVYNNICSIWDLEELHPSLPTKWI